MSVQIKEAELQRLTAIRGINDQYVTVALENIMRQSGATVLGWDGKVYDHRHEGNFLTQWPDYLLLQQIKRCVIRSASYQMTPVGPGEENICGERFEEIAEWDEVRGVYRFPGHISVADMGLVSQASLPGKVLLELVRRLQEEADREIKALLTAPLDFAVKMERSDDPPAHQ